MILPDVKGNEGVKHTLSELDSHNRMPHAIIISGGTAAQRDTLAVHLSMWAVCSSAEKPCGACKNCLNAKAKAHSDIYYAKGSGKTESYSKEELSRNIVDDAYLKPNQADRKVYVLSECDRRLPVISQNVFLKTLEEPPQAAMFILTCEDSRSLLETIRSRCTSFELETDSTLDGDALALASEIARGIISSSEIDLLRATAKLTSRQQTLETLDIVELILRDGLCVYSGGKAETDSAVAREMCKKMTKAHYLKMIDITQNAKIKVDRNLSLKLVGTWLCAQYRRILWQR